MWEMLKVREGRDKRFTKYSRKVEGVQNIGVGIEFFPIETGRRKG